jgi:periplasmic divalent cation tolerance protein
MTACANADEAGPIVDALLSKGLAACVQSLAINSHYIWRGKINHETETLLLIKCRTDRFDAIREEILRLHRYELPEIIMVPVTGGLDRYLRWIDRPD